MAHALPGALRQLLTCAVPEELRGAGMFFGEGLAGAPLSPSLSCEGPSEPWKPTRWKSLADAQDPSTD